MLLLTLRMLLARRLRLAMSGAAVVIGVAFLSGVLVFSNALSSTFDNIINGSTPDGVVRGESTEEFRGGLAGASQRALSPADVARLAALPEVARADGDVSGSGVSLLGADGTLVGGTGAPTLAFNRTGAPNMDGEPSLLLKSGRWAEGVDEIVLDAAAAERAGYRLGDDVTLLAPFGDLRRTLELVGTAEFNGGGTAGATLLVLSTSGAQQLLLGGADAFTRVSLTAAPGVSRPALAKAAAAVVPEGFEAVTGDVVAAESQDAIGGFLGVITTFLLAFAIIAVVVGGFIIVNTFSILTAQRSRELALLRALGASRRQVARSVLVEALVLSVLASSAAIVLGLLLARGLAALLGTVGLRISGESLVLTPGAVVTGYAVGIAVTVLAAYLPARRAGRVAPVAAMREDAAPARTTTSLPRLALGAVLTLTGTALAVVGVRGGPGSDAAWVGGAGLAWLLTLALLSPVIGRPVLQVCRAVFSRLQGAPGRLAGENALRDARRTGATASALMIGMTLVATIGVLAASLNASIDDTVEKEFSADLLVRTTTYLPFSTAVGDSIAAVPGVGTLNRQQLTIGRYDGDVGGRERVRVTGNDAAFGEVYSLDMVRGTQALTGQQAVVGESFARRHRLDLGDRVPLRFGGGGMIAPEVVGITRSTEVAGEVAVPLEQLAAAGVQRQDTTLSILLAPGADTATVRDGVDDAAAQVPVVGVFDREEFADSLRDRVDQLLYLIYGLLALAVVIAVIGIINTLGLSVIERTREIGLLRAVGLSRAGVATMVTLESVAIAVLGAVLGLGLGVGVGVLLQRALQDDLTSLGLPLGQLVAFLGIAVVVGVVAAALPAVRAARLDVLRAIATE